MEKANKPQTTRTRARNNGFTCLLHIVDAKKMLATTFIARSKIAILACIIYRQKREMARRDMRGSGTRFLGVASMLGYVLRRRLVVISYAGDMLGARIGHTFM